MVVIKHHEDIICPICNKKFTNIKSRKSKYCSRRCSAKSQIGKIGSMHNKRHSLETIEKMKKSAQNRSTSQYCKKISDSVKQLWQNEKYQDKQLQSKSIMISKISGNKSCRWGKPPSPNSKRGKGMFYNSPLQGKIWLRSSYEIAYAKYLDSQDVLWYYEMKVFNLDITTYTPNFYIPECDKYIEIKGYMFKNSQGKINKFLQLYPNINFKILYKEDLKKLGVL